MQKTQNNRSESLQRLQDLLQKLFRADAADLDFGIYRIINHRRDLIQSFIQDEIPSIIENALNANAEIESDREKLENLRSQVINAFGADVLNADGNLIDETVKERPLVKEYLEAQEQIGSPQTPDQRSDNVFNHLYTFFSRYYDNGDFIPRRRYSQTERYAVPYNGEEVYLHWANRDQYYVKSGEHFSNYRFKPNPKQNTTVIFDLQNVDIEKDNIKGDKRFFIPLSTETTYNPVTDEVCIPFEYRSLADDEKSCYGTRDQQEKIIDAAEPEIMGKLTKHYNALSALDHQTDDVTILKKHLRTYTRRNTADFFIHKNLEQFLNQELDVFIKNEVIPMSPLIFDDVNFNEENLKRVHWIETSKLVHTIASKIIDFLAHIEEFQKRLWLKKKFVLSTDYCFTLDRVPEEFYPEIIENTAQLEEWKDLFAIDEITNTTVGTDYTEPISVDFLKENPNLVLDTCHFDPAFKDRLLSHFDNLDKETDGLLIHGENFQGLNLLTEKYRESVETIYIDPPYNTGTDGFLYKNTYQHSSWLSFITDRIAASHDLLSPEGTIFISIDDNEQHKLSTLMDHIFGTNNFIINIAVISNLAGSSDQFGFAGAHEHCLVYSRIRDNVSLGTFSVDEDRLEEWEHDEKGYYKLEQLQRGSLTYSESLDYPIFVDSSNKIANTDDDSEPTINGPFTRVDPVVKGKRRAIWRWGKDKVRKNITDITVIRRNDGSIGIFSKQRPQLGDMPTEKPKSVFYKPEYGTRAGGELLKHMDPIAYSEFSYPKAIVLILDLLLIGSPNPQGTVLDYFGGSGTTAHATINLNRQDEGKRKYILIEMGHHFDTALMPRVKKAVYAEKWKDAKPISRESRLSHIFKYQRIESYEDALNNIKFNETEHNILLPDEHRLRYMLESETKGSPTFLNISDLQTPFSYQLKIVKDMQTQTQIVDLPETFNYLIGLSVQTRQCLLDGDRHYLVYRGTVGQKLVVIIWRETAGWKQEDWERDYQFIQEHNLTEGANEVYVNTDSNVPEAKSLDPLFKQLMFSQ